MMLFAIRPMRITIAEALEVNAALKCGRLCATAPSWIDRSSQRGLASLEVLPLLIQQLLHVDPTDRSVRSVNFQMLAAKCPAHPHPHPPTFQFGASKVDPALVKQLPHIASLNTRNAVFIASPCAG